MSRNIKVEGWLREAGARRIRVSGDNFVSTCPFHKDSKPSFALNMKNGMFVCYSAHCGVQGNLYKFLREALGWSKDKARGANESLESYEALTRVEDGGFVSLPNWGDRNEKEKIQKECPITEGHLGLYDFCPRYMLKRGFSKATLKRWEVGFDKSSNRVTIPVRDREGALVGMSKRATRTSQELPYLHLHFSKGHHLYGEHRRSQRQEGIIVVEGQLDAMAYDQVMHGKNGLLPVSTMGTRVTTKQVRMMKEYSKVVLAFDNPKEDRDGYATTVKIGDLLLPSLGRNLWVLDYPSNVCDLGDTLNHSFDFAKAEIPFDSWRSKNSPLDRRKVKRVKC